MPDEPLMWGLPAPAGLLCCLTGEGRRLSRRAWARLALLGAGGLALLQGCGGEGPGGQAPNGLLRRWARLGRLWREMSVHRRGEAGPFPDALSAFEELGDSLSRALDALPAWQELRVVCEERWQYIYSLLYGPTCYLPPPSDSAGGVALPPPVDIEYQVEELERLVAEGTLTKTAAETAAQVIAFQIKRLLTPGQPDEVPPTPEAELAGKRLTEMTVDRLGWLAGPPKEGEGLPPPTCYISGPPTRDPPPQAS